MAPLTVEPEQARERVLGSCLLDTHVLLFLMLYRAEKGKQTGLPGVEGLGLNEELTSPSSSDLTC